MKKFFLALVCLVFVVCLKAQHKLVFYCDVMSNAYNAANRVEAGNEFKKLLMDDLKKEGSFNNTYNDLKWVSIKSDKENTFRIITWQIIGENDIAKSYGLIQMKAGNIFNLNDNVTAYTKDLEYEAMDANNWYGSLYYNILETKTDNGKAYLLFGYDNQDKKNKVKIIDVLSFENGKPVFGAEIFKIKEGARPDLKSRILVEYSALANVNCNYNEGLDMIVHDFTVSRMGVAEDGGPAKIPDGTYVGYQWDGKYWKYIEQIAHQVSSPTEIFYQPKQTEEVKKDVFGRKKN